MDSYDTTYIWWQVLAYPVILLYATHVFVLVALYWRSRRHVPRTVPHVEDADLPWVTVQLPLFNEMWVAARVIRAACALDYPRVEIQVLDDSTDDTRLIVDEEVARLAASGVDVRVVRRNDRADFKAGALRAGLEQARGDLIAIFDADFVPPPDWLRRVVPELLADPSAGWVQSRWGHLNADASWVTRAQAVALDGHFVVEHVARVHWGLFSNFNGTAGLWRKQAIDDAGGWHGDTLTEDLDLSYRAQLKGWRMLYRPDVVVPAELPMDISAFKSQQFRWAKGGVQTARKLLKVIWRSDIGLARKLAATFHMTGYVINLMILLSVLAEITWLLLVHRPMALPVALAGVLMYAFWTASWFALCFTSQSILESRRRLTAIPVLVALGLSLSISNTRAIIDGLRGSSSPFVRTPKRGDTQRKVNYRVRVDYLPDLMLGALCLAAAFSSVSFGVPVSAVYLTAYSLCFIYIGLRVWSEQRGGSTPSAALLQPVPVSRHEDG